LPAGTAGRAYPLVHLTDPLLDLQGWMARVRKQTALPAGTGGLTAFEDERGYIHALFSWILQPPADRDTMLKISDLIIAHWPGRALHDAVLGEIKDLAAKVRAASVVLEVRQNLQGLRPDLLAARGFSPAGDAAFVAAGSLT
jgi:hypothetical protein